MTEPRRRGRPPGGGGDRRSVILAAARTRFAADGFAGASLRAIAREARVDPSLIAHYFGDKTGLLAASMELPFNPAQHFAEISAAGPDGLGERLIRRALGIWDEHPDTISTLLRTSIGSADGPAPFVDLVRGVMVPTVASVLTGDDRDLRAGLIASQVIGFGVLRYVLRIEPVASATIDDVAALHAPALQQLIDAR